VPHDPQRLAAIRSATDAPLLIGSGLTAENGRNYPAADGAIVGTSIKRDGNVDEPVDRDRAARIVESFKR
jgi:uncharacterized protein